MQSDFKSAGWNDLYKSHGSLWAGNPTRLPKLPFLSKDSFVLEVGSGNGKTLKTMVHRNWRSVALDISLEAAKLSNCISCGFVLVGDGRSLPFISSSFDAVFLVHVVGHLSSAGRKDIARESVRVLKPGGILYFRDFGQGDMRFGQGLEVEDKTFLRGGITVHYFSCDEVLNHFSNLNVVLLEEVKWTMRIRGHNHPRMEVVGVFQSPNID